MQLPLNNQEIIKLLPHRYPFLLVDRVIELDPGKKIAAIKNVSANEAFFQGHFPGNPVMPGVLIIEAMAQAGGILSRVTLMEGMESGEAPMVYFMSIDKVKFRKMVVPGDQLRLEAIPIRTGSRVWKMEGKAFVDGELVAEAEFVAQIGQ
jgi:3-hydroxyacyl-[acyl-carrier-protein] dehydratase